MALLYRLCLLLAIASLAASGVSAQEFGRIEDTEAAAPGFFYYARPGEAVVAVTAVGGVGQSGRYLLGDGATVADLLALSGGAQASRSQGGNAGEDATIRLYREGAVVYEAPLREVYSSSTPRLEENDIMEVVALVSTARGFYVHSEPGRGTVVVTAAGAFNSPGQYVITEGATVGELVALAGGLGEASRRSNERIRATVRLYRSGQVLLEAPLSELYSRSTPTLELGDVVDLESVRSTVFTWRDIVSIATGVGALALAVERFARL